MLMYFKYVQGDIDENITYALGLRRITSSISTF